MHVITKLVHELREKSDREVLISPTLLPSANWREYIKTATSNEYYGGLDKTFFTVRPSILWKQIYRSDSVHFAYSNQSFLSLSRVPVAPDTIWPTFTKDPSIRSELKEIAIKDLDLLLSLRHKELKKGGMFMLDLLAAQDLPEKSCWSLLNTFLQGFVDSGRITQEERSRIVMKNYQRDEEVINTVLDRHMNNFRIRHYDTVASRYPAWDRYLEHRDSKKLAKEYVDWLKEWTPGAILMALSEDRSQEEKNELINDVYDDVLRIATENPMPLDIQMTNLVLEKIR